MLRKNKTSRSPLSTPIDLSSSPPISSPVESAYSPTSPVMTTMDQHVLGRKKEKGVDRKLSSSPTIVLKPSPRVQQLAGASGGMSSSGSFLSLNRFLGSSKDGTEAQGSATVTSPTIGTTGDKYLNVPTSTSSGSGSGWKFGWFSARGKDREKEKEREREIAGPVDNLVAASSGSASELGAGLMPGGRSRGSSMGIQSKRSPKMSKGVISAPRNFVHRENGAGMSHLAHVQSNVSQAGSTASSPRSPTEAPIGLGLVTSASSTRSEKVDPPSPGRTWGRRATVGSPDAGDLSLGFDRTDLPPVPPLPPPKSAENMPGGGGGRASRTSTDMLRDTKSKGSGALGAASKRPWARSVDDLSKMLGMEKKPKHKVLLGGFQKQDDPDTGSPQPSPVLPTSASMMSFPVSSAASSRINLPTISSSASTPTSDGPMRPRTPVASMPISDGSNVIPLTKKKSREMASHLKRSSSRESLHSVLMGIGRSDARENQLDEHMPTGRKKGARRKTNSFSGKALLDVVSVAATGLIKASRDNEMDVNLPRQNDRKVSGGKASSPAMLYGSSTTAMDTSSVSAGARAKKAGAHGRSQSFNLLGGISIGATRDRQRSGQPDVGRTREGEHLGLRLEDGGLIRTPSGNARRTSQVIHKEGFLLKHNPPRSKPGRTGRTPSPNVIKGMSEDYFSIKVPVEASKNWKPNKAILRGTKLHFYKPPNDKRNGIESLFPAGLVDEAKSPTVVPSGSPHTPKHGRRPAQRVFWGTTKHPDLKTAIGTDDGDKPRVLAGTTEALAHELVFGTQFKHKNREGFEMQAFKVFLWCTLLSHQTSELVALLFRELEKCLLRAVDTADLTVAEYASRMREILGSVAFEMPGICYNRDGELLLSVRGILETCEDNFCREALWSSITIIRNGQSNNVDPPSEVLDFRIDTSRFNESEIGRVTIALHSLMLKSLLQLRRKITARDFRYNNQGDNRQDAGLFAFNHLQPGYISHAVFSDVLSRSAPERSLEARAERLNLWLRLADRSWDHGNYAAYFAICQAVFSPALLRLDELWTRIPSESIEMMAAWRTRTPSSPHVSLPFHQPMSRHCDRSQIGTSIPYLGSTLPEVTVESAEVVLSEWTPLALACAELDSEAILSTPTIDLPSCFSLFISSPTIQYRPLSQWMELSFAIQPLPISAMVERGWSRAEGRNMTALRPLLFTTPLPINTMFVGNSSPLPALPNRGSAAGRQRLSLASDSLRPTSKRTSFPSRRSSLSDSSSSRGLDSDVSRSDNLGVAIRRITGQLHNATIRIADEIELQLIEPESGYRRHRHSVAFDGSLSRTSSVARSSIVLDGGDRIYAPGARLPVTVKSASTERLIDILICGIEGDSPSVDDNGQMPLHVNSARKFSLDLQSYRRGFFAMYRSFLDPNLLFEYLKKRFYRAGEACLLNAAGDENLASAALYWLIGTNPSSMDTSRSEELSCYIRSEIVAVLHHWLRHGDGLRDILDNAGLLERMVVFVAEIQGGGLDVRTERENNVVSEIADWWQDVCERLVSKVSLCAVDGSDAVKTDLDRTIAAFQLLKTSPYACLGDELFDGLDTIGNTLAGALSQSDLHTACAMLEKQSRDPLGWYHCENSSHKNRQDRHLIEINSPHRMMRQRLGEPSLDSLPFVDGLPKSVRICLKGFESVKNGLCRALSNSDATLEDKASLLASLLSALGKAHRPEIVDKLEKRASMASVNARTANSTTITVPSFVEAVITDVLLTPRIRMEIEVWDRAMKVVGGRPDDLGAVMTAARLKNASKPTAHNSSDIAWLIRCLAEVIWSFPESPDFMVNFEKQRHLAEIVEIALPSQRDLASQTRYNLELEALLDSLLDSPAMLSPLRKPTGINLVLYETLFGSLISQEINRQDRESQTVVQLLRNRGEAKTRMANREVEYSNIMSKSATQKTIKAKKHVSDAFWWSSRPSSSGPRELLSTATLGLARSTGSLEFKTPKESTLTINLAGCRASPLNGANRSYVFEIVTPESLRYVLQAKSRLEMDSWIDVISKSSEMAMLRRKTFVEPTITEVAEPLPMLPTRLTLEEELLRDYGADCGSDAVPRGPEACMAELERRCLEEIGLYRIPGSHSRVDGLVRLLVAGRIPDLANDEAYMDPSTIASALKNWLASMPECLITSERYSDFILADKITERNDRLYAIRALIWSLPAPNFALLRRLISHLDLVNDHEEENQMTPRNLATCFAPTLFWPGPEEGGRDGGMRYIGHALNLIDTMICQRYWLFHDFEREVGGAGTSGGDGIGSTPSSPIPTNEEGFEAVEELIPVLEGH